MKRTHLAVILIPLALALPSCGGDDSNKSPTQAAGTSTPAEAEAPQSDSQDAGSGTSAKEAAPTGSGGTSSADADRAAKKPDSSKKQGSGGESPTAPRPNRKRAKPKTADERLSALSPAERRRLHKDLYEQGKNVCYAYGPEQLAKEYKLTGAGAQTIAQQYARLYEAATPTLVLPFQQGCLAGFRRFARNPPKS